MEWHFLTVISICFIKGITSEHKKDFYYLNWLYPFRTKNKPNLLEKICKNHEYYQILLPNECAKIIKYQHGKKSIKLPFGIYVDFESISE